MRYSKEHKDQTRAKVLSAASKAIRSTGPGAVSVAEVMGRVGLTVGGFYGYFPSKDVMIAEAVREMFRERYDRWLADVETVDPRHLLQGFFDFYLSWQHVSDVEGGCPIPTLSGGTAQMPPVARDQVGDGVVRTVAGLARVLARAGVGEERAQQEARSMLAEAVGAVTLARMVSDRSSAEEILAATKARLERHLATILDARPTQAPELEEAQASVSRRHRRR